MVIQKKGFCAPFFVLFCTGCKTVGVYIGTRTPTFMVHGFAPHAKCRRIPGKMRKVHWTASVFRGNAEVSTDGISETSVSHHGLRGDGQSVIVPWHTPKESVQTIGSPTVRTFARMACEGFMSCACFRRDEEMAAPTWLGVLLIIAHGLAGERTLRKNIINRDGFRAYDLSAFRMICGAYAR